MKEETQNSQAGGPQAETPVEGSETPQGEAGATAEPSVHDPAQGETQSPPAPSNPEHGSEHLQGEHAPAAGSSSDHQPGAGSPEGPAGSSHQQHETGSHKPHAGSVHESHHSAQPRTPGGFWHEFSHTMNHPAAKGATIAALGLGALLVLNDLYFSKSGNQNNRQTKTSYDDDDEAY